MYTFARKTLPGGKAEPPHRAKPKHELSIINQAHTPDFQRANHSGLKTEKGAFIQAKSAIHPAGDRYEQEADRVATHIVNPTAGKMPVISRIAGTSPYQRQTNTAQRNAAQAATAPPALHRALNTTGRPLDVPTRTHMESRFGQNFSQVRVHTGREAAQSARRIGARAYTSGNHIAFSEGEYRPGSRKGNRLLAHELTHVIQQGGRTDAGVIQRAETDDRSCTGLTDIMPDVNSKVTSEISSARGGVGTSNIPVFLNDVRTRLGDGAVSPIEKYIESLPASKRTIPPTSLSGTKYSGVSSVNRFYLLQTMGLAHVVGSHAKVNGICIGADKLGHFFNEGFVYYQVANLAGFTVADAEKTGRALEIGIQGLSSTGVLSNADMAANKAGMKFYTDLAANPTGLTFDIKNYITTQWNEQTNPSYYESSVGGVVWSNLLTGRWKGPFTGVGASAIDSKANFNATSASLTGTYEWPAAKPSHYGNINNGVISQKTTAISGKIPGRAAVSANAVSGISIDFDWNEGSTSKGKGTFNSTNEQTLQGTWGVGSSKTNGGTWNLKKV